MNATHSEIYLGLLKLVKAVDPDMTMVVRGMPMPTLDRKDEWMCFDILSIISQPCRRNTIETYVDIQLILYSLHAEHRSDKKFDAIYRLIDKYGDLFHQKDVTIKNTCIQFKENRIVPLDLRSTGDFAKEILNQLPALHTMSVVILNQGLISSSK
jgi:hypothetical protein